jgi:pimeloyl-ACP methyl ester carboxylesterase
MAYAGWRMPDGSWRSIDGSASGFLSTGLIDPIVFIGGANDATSRIVYNVFRSFAAQNTDLIVRYFSHDQRRAILTFLKSYGAAPITLVGHSWGADTAAAVAASAPKKLGRAINLLITIDPVGRFTSNGFFERVAAGTDRWVNVFTPSNSSRGDTVAGVGGRWGDDAAGFADVHFNSTLVHEDFSGMLRESCPNFHEGGTC